VTVGGAAIAGAIEAEPPRTATEAMAKLKQIRLISLLPTSDAARAKVTRNPCVFKAAAGG
jgi:hypothetical protein